MFTLGEIRILIGALETLELEYGERPERTALLDRLYEGRDRLAAEIEAAR